MREHKIIWLQPWCDECEENCDPGREWCQDKQDPCDVCGREWVKYDLAEQEVTDVEGKEA